MWLSTRSSVESFLLEIFRNIPRITFLGMLSFLGSSRHMRGKSSGPLHVLIVPWISQ
jgi:hypothetical protein